VALRGARFALEENSQILDARRARTDEWGYFQYLQLTPMSLWQCGPVTDRLSPTVTVAPPSSKMTTYRMEFDVEGASKLLDTYFAGSEVKAAQFYRAL
jgi:hypothetical protein